MARFRPFALRQLENAQIALFGVEVEEELVKFLDDVGRLALEIDGFQAVFEGGGCF
jgi:hypothetical protein